MAEAEYSDVLIIGAGISGIGAAYRIHEKNPKLSYTVLERRARIGGSDRSTSARIRSRARTAAITTATTGARPTKCAACSPTRGTRHSISACCQA